MKGGRGAPTRLALGDNDERAVALYLKIELGQNKRVKPHEGTQICSGAIKNRSRQGAAAAVVFDPCRSRFDKPVSRENVRKYTDYFPWSLKQ